MTRRKRTLWTHIHKKTIKKRKKYTIQENLFQKDKFTYYSEIKTHICPLEEIFYRRKKYEYKNKQRITYWTNECKNYIIKEIYHKKKNYKIIQDYGNPSKIKMQRKMETEWAQKFTTTGIKNKNTEFKLYTIGHNLKKYTTK